MHFIAWLFNSLEYLFLNFFVKKDSIERFFSIQCMLANLSLNNCVSLAIKKAEFIFQNANAKLFPFSQSASS